MLIIYPWTNYYTSTMYKYGKLATYNLFRVSSILYLTLGKQYLMRRRYSQVYKYLDSDKVIILADSHSILGFK